MKKILFFFIVVLFSFSAKCQVNNVNFNDCDPDGMFVKADAEPHWNCDSLSLIEYMNKYTKDTNIRKIKSGRIFIGILIDITGKTCCYSLLNSTGTVLDNDMMKELVNQMPDWDPAKVNKRNVKFLKQQIFYIKKGKFVSQL